MIPPLRVVGLDLSLTSTGMSDGQTHGAVGTDAGTPLEERVSMILSGVVSFVTGAPLVTALLPEANLVVIEGGAFSRGAQSKAAEDLAGLRLLVRYELWARSIPFAIVPPTTLKKYTTGDGRASKPDMVAALADRHGIDLSAVRIKDGRYDQADAIALAAMGYDHVGQPLDADVPFAPHRASLDAVQWPELMSDN